MERRPRRRYTREFKLEAVRLAAVDERPKAQIARQLGIRVNQLRKWVSLRCNRPAKSALGVLAERSAQFFVRRN